MKTSDSIEALSKALAAAQGEFTNPERNREVEVTMKNDKGQYTFVYATLDAIIEMARPALAKNGLAIMQPATTADGCVIVATRLAHESGEWIEESMSIASASGDPQAIGSLITYMRRYSLSSLLGIASEEDDDGNTAQGNGVEMKPRESLPACPKCGETKGVIRGKEEYGGGLVCFAKKGGCGHKWQPDAKPAATANNATPAAATSEPVDPYVAGKHAIGEAATLAKLGTLLDRLGKSDKLDADQKNLLAIYIGERAVTLQESFAGERAEVIGKAAELQTLCGHTFA